MKLKYQKHEERSNRRMILSISTNTLWTPEHFGVRWAIRKQQFRSIGSKQTCFKCWKMKLHYPEKFEDVVNSLAEKFHIRGVAKFS